MTTVGLPTGGANPCVVAECPNPTFIRLVATRVAVPHPMCITHCDKQVEREHRNGNRWPHGSGNGEVQ